MIQDILKTLKREFISPRAISIDVSVNPKIRESEHLSYTINNSLKVDFNIHPKEVEMLTDASTNLGSGFDDLLVHLPIREVTVKNNFSITIEAPAMLLPNTKLGTEELSVATSINLVPLNIRPNLDTISNDYLLKIFTIKKHSIPAFDKKRLLKALIDMIKIFNLNPRNINIVGVFKRVPWKEISNMEIRDNTILLKLKSNKIKEIRDILVVREKSEGKVFFYPLKD